MLLNLIKNSILDILFAILAYMQGGPRKKQLITSFLRRFTKNQQSTLCISFQVHNPKLSQEGCFKPYFYYPKLCTGPSTIASFVKHFKENPQDTVRLCFQLYIPKLVFERCFILSLQYGTIYRVLYERSS